MKKLALYLLLFIVGCSPANSEMKNIYNNRVKITDLFAFKSVMRGRGQNIILFYTYKDKKTNKYFFEISNNQYEFTNDSVEYTTDIMQLKGDRGSELYKRELISQIKMLMNKMDELNIRDFKSDLFGVGIDCKFF